MPAAENIERVVVKVRLTAGKGDTAFWKGRSYTDRLEALEQIRKAFIRWKYGADPRLQRVYKIVKQP